MCAGGGGGGGGGGGEPYIPLSPDPFSQLLSLVMISTR